MACVCVRESLNMSFYLNENVYQTIGSDFIECNTNHSLLLCNTINHSRIVAWWRTPHEVGWWEVTRFIFVVVVVKLHRRNVKVIRILWNLSWTINAIQWFLLVHWPVRRSSTSHSTPFQVVAEVVGQISALFLLNFRIAFDVILWHTPNKCRKIASI